MRGDWARQPPHVPYFQRVIGAAGEQHAAVGRCRDARAGFWHFEPCSLGGGDEGRGRLMRQAHNGLGTVVGAVAAPKLQRAIVAYCSDRGVGEVGST